MKYLLLLFCGLAVGCSPKLSQRVIATQVRIQQLQAVNLSEDMSAMSSLQDEIFYKITFVKKEGTDFQPLDELASTTFFNSKSTQETIDKSYPLSDADFLIFSLVEIDNESSESHIDEVLNEEIRKGDFLNFQKNRTVIDSLLGDDDILGMKYFNLEKPIGVGRKEVKISGRHLFDKFDYRFHLLFE